MSERVRTPRQQVTGVLDDADRLAALLEDLRAAGFSEEGVASYAGEEVLATIDPDGHLHGLRGRIMRSLENFGQEGEEHRAAAAEVQAGHMLVVVTVSDDGEKERAAAALRAQGLHRLRYWDRWDIELLSP